MYLVPPHRLKTGLAAAAILVLGASSSSAADVNSAYIGQAGTAGHAYIEQVAGVGNDAVIQQGTASAGAHAAILQTGDDNAARIIQDGGRDNFAVVKSFGNRNRHSEDGVVQHGSYNTAFSIAAGYDNQFAIAQTSAGGPNLAAQLQVGSRNLVTTAQSNDFASASAPYRFVSMARELPLEAPGAAAGSLELHGMALPILAANASLQIQVGKDNHATATQRGSSNLLIQKQVGDRNLVSAEQTGSFNFLTHIQIGNDIASPTIHQTGGATAVVVQTR